MFKVLLLLLIQLDDSAELQGSISESATSKLYDSVTRAPHIRIRVRQPEHLRKMREEVLQLCIKKLRSMPEQRMDMKKLANEKDIRTMKQGVIAKFHKWIRTHKEVFQTRGTMDKHGEGLEIFLNPQFTREKEASYFGALQRKRND